mmetsp:Transcript_48052/g.107883  ORF Transcript_48052/g.107883 Transcript_48052/m.107883 type:complete len:335 (+) Transcript_48052:29-1033(+)
MAPKKASSGRRPRTQAVVERDFLPPNFLSQAWSKRRGEGEDAICGACLLGVESDTQVGLVDNCSHIFHFECVERWAQTENTCPQCKVRFFWLAAYRPTGKRTSLKRVERRDQEPDDEDSREEVYTCEKCKEVGDENALLLCDGMHGTCNACFHFTCVGLTEVPRGSWFCPDCADRGFDIDAKGNRGKRPAEDDMPGEGLEINSAASSATSFPDQAGIGGTSVASDAPALPDETSASGQGARRRRMPARAGGPLPPQLRLSSLACVTPAVSTPGFRAMSSSTGLGLEAEPAGLFASFAQRRKARRTEAVKPDSSGQSFINLEPVYQDDFIGSSLK